MRKASSVVGIVLGLIFSIAFSEAGFAANFGTGNIVVLRADGGGAALTGNAAAVFLDEYTPSGTKLQSIALPTTASGSNKQLTISGTSTAEGALRRSVDGRYLSMGGYAVAPGTATSGVSRVVGQIDGTGNIDTTTVVSGLASTSIRGVVTDDGTRFWAAGGASGMQYVTLGQTTASTQINSAAPTNLRVPGIFNNGSQNQLYVSSASGTFLGVGTVGSGLPTTGGQPPAILSGLPTSGTHSSYGFFFADANTLYIADDGTSANGGGIQKWTYNGSTWSQIKILNLATPVGFRGLTGYKSGSNVVIYATTNETSANRLVTVTDDGSTSPAFTTVATAAQYTVFRGVDLAPLSPVDGVCGGDSGSTLAATAPTNLCTAGTASAVTGSGHPWSWTCTGSNGGSTASCSATIQTYSLTFNTDGNGTLSGNVSQTVDYSGTSEPVTATPNGGYSFLNWTGTNGFVTSTANPLTLNNVTSSQIITANFSATPVNGACGTDNGQTLTAMAPTKLCATGNPSAVGGSGHPWTWTCDGSNGGSTTSCSATIQTYTLTFNTDGNGTLSGTTSQTIDYGASASPVTGNANSGYSFKNWSGSNGFVTTTTNPLTINNVTSSLTITANFKGGFTIFHVNDTHARMTPHWWVIPAHSTTDSVFEEVGGAAYLAGEMLSLTAANPNALVLDAGDISEGNPLGDMINPALCGDSTTAIGSNCSMTQFYQLLSSKLSAQRGRGMDAVVVGNHDVRDANYINNLTALQNAGVPVISVNVRNISTHQPYFAPYTTVTVNGTKIGIIGYTTGSSEVGASLSSTLEVASCPWSGNTTGPNPCDISTYVNHLRNDLGCDVVILLAHAGHSELVDPTAPIIADNGAAKLPEVAVTGHWHTWTDTVWQPEMLNYKTIFTESASYMKYIGELQVTDEGRYISSTQHVIRDADIAPDSDVQTLITNLTGQYNAANPGHPVDELIGYTADDLLLDNEMKWWSAEEYPWSGNNSAGQWICDAMQWKAAQLFGQCDLALEAGGGVRADIPAGPVTYMQIYETFPWSDDLFTRVNMTGQEIINFLKATNMDAGFSAALDVTAFDGIPTSVKFNGQPIDLNHTYTVAINNYMYAHPPTGWTWSDASPLTSTVLCRDGIVDYMRQFTLGNPYHVGGPRYHLNTEFSGGYRAVVTMMNDNDTKPVYEYAFIRLLSATPETLARRGSNQVPSALVNADGTINAANRLSEQELYRSYLGFKTGALQPGDIIETWGKGSFYGGNPEFVDQEGIYADGVEFKIVGHDATLAMPVFVSSIGSFWNDSYKNHYVQFLAKKTGANTVADQFGQTIKLWDATGYAAKTLPGSVGDMLLISGVPTMESYALRFRSDSVVTSSESFPAVVSVSSNVDAVPGTATTSPLTLTATASATSGTWYLAPIADAQVASGRATTNYGTSTNLYVQSAASGYGDERAWLKFDLSVIPAGSTISGSVLQLWDWKATGAALPAEVRGGNDDSWTETGINWNNQPAFGSPLDVETFAAGSANLWYTWDVTSFAQGKWSGNKLVSLVVKAVTEGSTDATPPSYAFDAREYGSNTPVLQVSAQDIVTQVQYFYRHSSDGITWGGWTLYGTASSAPWTTSFTYPEGAGHYEFYSVASDASGNVQPTPLGAQAAVVYTPSGGDVSAQCGVTSTGLLYSRASRLYTGKLIITNNGPDLSGTIDVVLNGLTTGVTLVNATGQHNGAPMIQASTNGLAAGASITIPLQFSNPANARINFTPAIFQE